MAIKKMKATIQKDIDIIHRFDPPHTYQIGNTGVSIDLRYQAWPSVITDENGTVYAFISGRLQHIDPFGQTLLYKSTDNGETWSEPIIVNDTPMDDRDVGAVYLGDGKMMITYFRIAAWDLIPTNVSFQTADGVTVTGSRDPAKRENGGYLNGYLTWLEDRFTTQEQRDAVLAYWKSMNYADLEGGNWCLYSEDYGKTWTAPRRTPVSSPHGMMQLKNGDIMYVGRGFDGPSGDGIYAYTTKDYGVTWEKVSLVEATVSPHHLCCEPHAVELENGRIVVAIRIQWNVSPLKLNGENCRVIGYDFDDKVLYKHDATDTFYVVGDNGEPEARTPLTEERTGYRIHVCHSDDGGKTWSKPEFVVAQNPKGLEKTNGRVYGTPPHLLVMPNGAIVMTYATRNFDIGERAIVSYDNGETWDEEIVLCNKPYDSAPGSKWNYIHMDIGYPATTLMKNGQLLSVYYQAYTGDRYCSFLCTKWTLK